VGFIILLLLGAITAADFKSVFQRKKTKNPKKNFTHPAAERDEIF
jgi:hypothetical protein